MKSRSTKRGSKGQAQVEFALTVVFVILLILGSLEIIVLIYNYSVLADAAKEGVRYAVVHGTGVGHDNCSGPGGGGITCTDSTGANVVTAVTNYAAGAFQNTPALASGVSVTYQDASSVAPNRVRVTVSYEYQAIFGLGWPTVTLNAAAEGRIVF
jgi:Flp pilus assembly protein TadG